MLRHGVDRVDPDRCRRPPPEVDDHLVEPGTPYEMWDGELVYVPPCDAPHGTSRATLASLLVSHVAPGFAVACELLTRTSRLDDIAPDVSVFPAAPHPVTGRRQLQQLAFEVVSTQRLAGAAGKAAKLAGRGVRRVFAVDVQHTQVLEWSAARNRWEALPAAGHIVDSALAVPLPLAPLFNAARVDDAGARALIAQGNPVLMSYLAEDEAEGRAAGFAKGLAECRAAAFAERPWVTARSTESPSAKPRLRSTTSWAPTTRTRCTPTGSSWSGSLTGTGCSTWFTPRSQPT